MGNPDSNFRDNPSEKREVAFDPKHEFDKLGREALDLYNGMFSLNFVKLSEAAEDFKNIDVGGAKYLTLQTYEEEVNPVVLKFLKAMNSCKRACRGLEKRFSDIADLARRYPELLKWERFAQEINEIELRVNDALVKLAKYEKTMVDVETVVNAWPDTNYNPLKAVYQTAQRPIGQVWGEFVGEKSVLNNLAVQARVGLEEVVHDFVMEDENDVTSKAEDVIEEGGKVAKKIAKKAANKVTDFIDSDGE